VLLLAVRIPACEGIILEIELPDGQRRRTLNRLVVPSPAGRDEARGLEDAIDRAAGAWEDVPDEGRVLPQIVQDRSGAGRPLQAGRRMQAQGQNGRHHEWAEAELGPFGRARVAPQNGGIVRIRGPEATQPLLDPAGGTVEGGGKIANAPGGMGALPSLDGRGLRDCQRDAIEGLEHALADDKPRSLIQMATGAGKTFTACTFSHRLITYGKARRILFLVDRTNLGEQMLKEFQNFQAPGAAHRFTDTYIVQHLQSNRIDPDAKVVITTIQRLYAMLRGQELDPADEEASGFETWEAEDGAMRPVQYNPDVPIETFDFIITDECHRSIYGVWRQVLEYFNASIIGLTATPSKHTLAFFNQNHVAALELM
jgi:hypothetical protein